MKYLITSALPYANGPLHFGHLCGVYIPADVYARFRKLQGHTVKHISGSDEHGVAIMLNAKKAGKNYQEYVNQWNVDHKDLFKQLDVEFDFFGQTSASYHRDEVLRWFTKLYEQGDIETKEEQQLYCEDCKNHLPDRFVEGTCYVCGFEKARGDECPQCGEWITPVKLKNPVCKICENKNRNIKVVAVKQYYLLLSKFHQRFREWFAGKKHWRKTVVPYVDSLSKESLQDRAITRDLDWGIDVPLPEAKGKKLYVWFDAPIGYVSNLKEHLRQIGSKEDYIEDWWRNKDVEISHFIGKDNIIFHCIIFPVMALATGFINPPSDVPANQYLNLEGQQFSKSSGWYVDAKRALKDFGSDALRYYLISIMPETSDSSFTWSQFAQKVNTELSNNIGNFINRSMKFLHKNWPEGLSSEFFAGFVSSEEGKQVRESIGEINRCLGQQGQIQIKKALETLMGVGLAANLYFTNRAPWAQIKEDREACAQTMAYSCLFTYVLGVLFSPFLPNLSKSILSYFGKEASPFLSVDSKKAIWAGQIEILEKLFTSGFKLQTVPEGLVPKIDEKLIGELEAELKGGRP